MIVIIAENVPDCVRGMLKRWFIEPKPNVFVGTINKRTQEKTLNYIHRNSPKTNMLIICSDNSSQKFFISTFGETKLQKIQLCGLDLIAEKVVIPTENSHK